MLVMYLSGIEFLDYRGANMMCPPSQPIPSPRLNSVAVAFF